MHNTDMKVKEILKRQIDEVVSKGSIDPCELDCLEKSYCILAKMSEVEAMDEYSRNPYPNSFGPMYPDTYGDMTMRRGRGMNGRFVSRNGSFHSVNDRMIAALEMELDNATSDFERQKIMEEIRRLREMKD